MVVMPTHSNILRGWCNGSHTQMLGFPNIYLALVTFSIPSFALVSLSYLLSVAIVSHGQLFRVQYLWLWRKMRILGKEKCYSEPKVPAGPDMRRLYSCTGNSAADSLRSNLIFIPVFRELSVERIFSEKSSAMTTVQG